MTAATLADLVRCAAEEALRQHGLDPARLLPPAVAVERPPSSARGDYSTSLALRTAGRAGVAPRTLAGWLAEALRVSPDVRRAEVAGPGFVNFWVTLDAHARFIRAAVSAGPVALATPPCSTPPCSTPPWPAAEQVRYAHARMAALVRNAADVGITLTDVRPGLLEYLQDEPEQELIRALGEFPCVVAVTACQAADGQGAPSGQAAPGGGHPHRLRRYLERLAVASHVLSETHRVLPMGDENPGPQHTARLALCQATRQVLANGLRLLEMSAPERM